MAPMLLAGTAASKV